MPEDLGRQPWGMPYGHIPKLTSFHTLRCLLKRQTPPVGKAYSLNTIHFKEVNFSQHLAEVAQRLEQKLSRSTKTITLDTDEVGLAQRLFDGEHKIAHHSTYFPWKENDPHSRYVYRGGAGPSYPVYIISKGRWDNPLTARALERMKVPYTIVVEPGDYMAYKAVFAGAYLGRPYQYGTVHKAGENFSERGQGSIPVRNYVWDLAIKTGAQRHWLMDDNIPSFNRTHYVEKHQCNLGMRAETGAIFRAVESFADRYENVAITGLNNSQFVVAKQGRPYLCLNQRVYSCTLIQNDLRLPTEDSDGRWRGRYNEDTDLCIRALKTGWCTVLFYTFNADKVSTMTMRGGNTDVLYAGDGRTKMAESLRAQHPDVVKVGKRWSRDQHVVDYHTCVALGKASGQHNGCALKLKEGTVISEGVDEFGMRRFDLDMNRWDC